MKYEQGGERARGGGGYRGRRKEAGPVKTRHCLPQALGFRLAAAPCVTGLFCRRGRTLTLITCHPFHYIGSARRFRDRAGCVSSVSSVFPLWRIMAGMRRRILMAVAVLVAVAGPNPGAARQPAHAPPGVPVRVIVTDMRGRHVAGLSAGDLEISEGGRPQTVQSFASAPKGSRRIAILLDDYHVSAGPSAERAVASLLQFADQQVRPDDIVFLMRPLDPASSIAPVKDRDELRANISKFQGRKENYAPRNEFEAEYLSAAPPTATRQRAQIVRAAMHAATTALSRPVAPLSGLAEAINAPRALIVVTEGFAPDDRGRERLASLRTVARAARLANVAVYVVDPSPGPREQPPFGEQWQLLASQTGGLLTTGGVALVPTLAQVSADLDGSYMLTIPPPEREDGAYHRLEIKVKRRDVAVRAPSGYWAPIAAERLTPPVRPAMSTYLKTPHVSGLIQPWFRMTRARPGRTLVTFSWVPKVGHSRGVSVAFSAVTFEGARLSDGEVAPQDAIAGVTRAVFDAAPGPLQVSMAIKDVSGKLLDTEVRYIDVPALETPGAMIAAVEVLRTRTLREFLERQLVADIMPADTTDFDRHDRLIVRVRAFSQTGDAPLVSARLLNPLGQPMRELTPLPSIEGIPQFDLPLASYARGEYRIEIRATSGKSSAAQLVMFRLIG